MHALNHYYPLLNNSFLFYTFPKSKYDMTIRIKFKYRNLKFILSIYYSFNNYHYSPIIPQTVIDILHNTGKQDLTAKQHDHYMRTQ